MTDEHYEANGWRGRLETRVEHLERQMDQLNATCGMCRTGLDTKLQGIHDRISSIDRKLTDDTLRLEREVTAQITSLRLKIVAASSAAAALGSIAWPIVQWFLSSGGK